MAALTLCALVWAAPGQDDRLATYEDRVLGLLSDHGARVVSRARSRGEGADEVSAAQAHGADALQAVVAG